MMLEGSGTAAVIVTVGKLPATGPNGPLMIGGVPPEKMVTSTASPAGPVESALKLSSNMVNEKVVPSVDEPTAVRVREKLIVVPYTTCWEASLKPIVLPRVTVPGSVPMASPISLVDPASVPPVIEKPEITAVAGTAEPIGLNWKSSVPELPDRPVVAGVESVVGVLW